MKLTTFILLSTCLAASAKGLTQGVNISKQNAPLQEVFKDIEKQTGYQFFYKEKVLEGTKTVTINVKNATLEQVLLTCFKDQPVTYNIVDKIIVVTPKQPLPNDVEGESLDHQITKSPIDVSGKVTDADGNPLIGATVKVKGSSLGTTTNADGVFVLKGVDDNAVLEISYVGYETYTVAINNKTSIVASLKVKPENLNEVVINKGYYTERQKYSVGNVGKVTAKDIERQPVQNPMLALQGRVPGLVVTQTNGLPGGGVTVRIQGQNSIRYGNDPLYVIDGVPYFNQLPSTGAGDGIFGSSGNMPQTNSFGSPLNYLNPGDIESIEVLKDADATSIYGSRAANGVILITTKKGKAGDMKLDINMQAGFGEVAHKWDMMNTRQYLDMRYEALRNDNINLYTVSNTDAKYYDLKVWDTTRYTDWQKELIGGTAKYTLFNASISGGTNNFQYLISGTYNKQTTVFPGDFNDKKGSLHFSITSNSPNKKLQVKFSGNYVYDDNKLLQSDLTPFALQMEPDAPSLYNNDGTLNWAPNSLGNSTWVNPLSALTLKYRNKTNGWTSSFLVSYQILPGLNITANSGFSTLTTNDFGATPLISVKPELRASSSRFGQYGNRELGSYIFEPQLTYKRKLFSGDFDVLVGGTLQQQSSKSVSVIGFGYNSDDVLENMMAATQILSGSQYEVQYRYNAGFGRVNYNWESKYIVNLTGRRDGSSRFGRENQFNNFWSAGSAWIFSEEKFLQHQNIVSFGKIRFSYGTTGSDQIGDYAFMSLYGFTSNSAIPYQSSIGAFPQGISNEFLQWEETRKLQFGVDLGFFSNRILIGATFNRNRTGNQLLSYQLPTIAGFSAFAYNLPAVLQNKTLEFSATTTNLSFKNFHWTTNFNLSIPDNKLVSFPGLDKSSYSGQYYIGQPIGLIRTYYSAGVDPATGSYIYLDSKSNPTTSPNSSTDRNAFINLTPKYYGGIQNNFSYGGIELDVLFQFSNGLGNNLSYFNGLRFPGVFVARQSNQPLTVLERWQKPGDQAPIARITSGSVNFLGGTFSYVDASYLRLKNLSLSCSIPSNWQRTIGLKNCKVYLQGQNLLTITKWKGPDVETQNTTSLPPLRLLTFGVRAGF